MPAKSAEPLRWHRFWLCGGWGLVASIIWLSLTPSPPHIDVSQGDKLGHFLGYGSLMFWFSQIFGSRDARIGYGSGFIAMGIALEFAQGALGYRNFEVFDMFANALGVLIGWALALAGGQTVFVSIEKFASRHLRI